MADTDFDAVAGSLNNNFNKMAIRSNSVLAAEITISNDQPYTIQESALYKFQAIADSSHDINVDFNTGGAIGYNTLAYSGNNTRIILYLYFEAGVVLKKHQSANANFSLYKVTT